MTSRRSSSQRTVPLAFAFACLVQRSVVYTQSFLEMVAHALTNWSCGVLDVQLGKGHTQGKGTGTPFLLSPHDHTTHTARDGPAGF